MRSITRRLLPLLEHPRLPWLGAGLALLIALPSLAGGIALDDYFHVLALQGRGVEILRGNLLLDLFNFLPPDGEGRAALEATGILPWWAPPDLRGSFLRPVTAATHVLDYWLWPSVLPLHHAHNLLWFVLGLLAVARLFREAAVKAAPAVVGLAGLLFCIEDAHVLPAVWLANRNAMIALTFGVWGVIMHLRWRRLGGVHRLGLSLLLTLLGLLSAEAALGAVGYIAAYELTRKHRGPWVRRLLPLAPVSALVLGWRAVYSALGYGAAGMSLYLDPLGEPLAFMLGLLERGPILLFHQWTQVNIDGWVALPRAAQLALAAAGWLTAAGVYLLLRPLLRRNRSARFWALGMVLALLPASGAFPMARLTLFAGIGAAALLAALAGDLGLLGAREGPPENGARVRATRVLLWMHGPIAAGLLLFAVLIFPAVTANIPREARAAAPASDAVKGQDLVLINSYDMYTMYIPAMRMVHGLPPARSTTQLASIWSDLVVSRSSVDALTITPEHGFLAASIDSLFWSPRGTFAEGEVRETVAFSATVDKVTSDGRPRTVTFKFKVPLDDPNLLLRAMIKGKIVPFELPAVGEKVILPWTMPAL